jgi:transposase
MAGRRIRVLDVREIVRRLRLGESDREVAQDVGVTRRTVVKYRKLAEGKSWLSAAEMPAAEEIMACLSALAPPPVSTEPSSAEPHRETILALRKAGEEIQAILQILRDRHGYRGSYSSVWRFIKRLEPGVPGACARVETAPGEEAQVDFGCVGKKLDTRTGKERRAWSFVMTLGFSRHQYAELVFDQKSETWLGLHVRAFEWFGGVPARVKIDNLKAGILKACWHDPRVQRSYREMAEHYGFLIAACKPGKPEHKGKVESGVRYVKRNALAGRGPEPIADANAHLRRWIMDVAGVREHGTTHEAPLLRFNEVEKAALKPLPATRYELTVWKEAKLHADCHVVFEKSFYSAPHRLIGQQLLLRATPERVEIYHEHERVASHSRAQRPGTRVSTFLHYPPTLLEGVMATPVRLRAKAAEAGPSTSELVGLMLDDKPVDRLRQAQGVVGFIERYGAGRLEAACRRALVFGEASYRAVSTILREGLENMPLAPEAVSAGRVPSTATFARPVADIAAHL